MRHVHRLSSSLALALLAASSTGQSCSLEVQGPDRPFLEPVWGGETRHVHTWHRPLGEFGHDSYRVWTAEDGGRIRYAGNGGESSLSPWWYQDTPADVGGTLLDVWFLDDGMTGWACGRGGTLLFTDLAGWSGWSHLDPSQPVMLDADGNPATIWRTRWFDASIGLVAGVKLFRATVDGGLTWFDLNLYEDAAFTIPVPLSEMRLYGLDLRGHPQQPGGFLGALAGRRLQDLGGPEPVETGLVFHTDSTLAGTSAGRKWWVTLDDSATPADGLWPPSGPGDMREPWDLAFERDTTAALGDTVGYVVGGRGVGNPGRIFRTENGGLSWTEEGADPTGLPAGGVNYIPTLYGVGARADFAVADGYGGQVWVRDPGASLWRFALQATSGSDFYSGPLGDADVIRNPDTGLNEAFAVGSFGFHRASRDGGLTWDAVMPAYDNQWEEEWRLAGLAALDDQSAFVCGQFALIARTVDGGCTLERVHGGKDSGLPANDLYDVAFEAPGVFGVAVGDNTAGSGLWYSADGGSSWAAPGSLPAGADTWKLKDVDHLSALEFWAVGSTTGGKALFVRTTDGGQSWQELDAPTTNSTHLEAFEVVPGTGAAIVVGRRGNASAPRATAWTFQVTAGVNTHQVVLAPQAPGTELFDVDLRGSSLATAEAFAVGRGGMVLTWDGSTFADTPGVFSLSGSPAPLLSTDMTSVSLSPSPGTEVLVVPSYPTETFAPSTDVGFMLRRRAGVWSRLASWLGAIGSDAELVADGLGFVAATSAGVATGEGGNVADSALARYDDVP